MSKIKVIKVFVEKAEDGTYWGNTQNIPGVVSAYGSSLEELKDNLKAAFDDYIEVAENEKEKWAKEVKKMNQWDYQMNLEAFFDLIPEIKISAIGKKAKINESLMRQYVSGKAAASEERVKLIEKAIHELGRELQSISF
ncbi:MAG: type II toxin-antitoxin system HicB family antitoxin [Bacteroidota bacterium]